MRYIDLVKNVYSTIIETDFKNVLKDSNLNFDEVNNKLQKKFQLSELRESYVHEIKNTINRYLPFFEEDFNKFLKIKEVSFYYYNISSSTASHLFWIWNKKLKLNDESLHIFIESFFLGVFGYKMIDFQNDSQNSNPELSFVGLYSIKIAEQMLEKILGAEITNRVFIKYAKMYTEIEYREKKNKWKSSIFSWNNPKELGLKASPTYIVYESLFRYAGFEEKKINDLLEGLIYFSSALQLIDDLADARQDLENGYETLVMQSYYNTFNFSTDVNEEKINQILSQERLKLVYKTGQELFNKARKLFEKHDEPILQLLVEIQNLNFTTLFEIGE